MKCVLISLTFLLLTFAVTNGRQHALKAKTLHLSKHLQFEYNRDLGFIVEADTQLKFTETRHGRNKRATSPGDTDTSGITTTIVHLQDNHTQMIVHWEGEKSDVIIALSKDGQSSNTPTSDVFVSYNYGQTFASMKDEMQIRISSSRTNDSIIEQYYTSPLFKKMYIFTDVVHNYIFTTRDSGRNFDVLHVPFRPETIVFHPTESDIILGMDKNSTNKRLYLSRDFGFSWTQIQVNVKTFYWGVKPYDDHADYLYVVRSSDYGKNTVVRSHDFFNFDEETVISGVEDFELRGEYLFATKLVSLLGSPTHATHLQLYTSYKRGVFSMALFPKDNLPHTDYYIADVSDGQVFVCVSHNNTYTHLYLSDIQGHEYSLSLRNVIYFNPEGSNKDTWLRYFKDESFADIHLVDGMRGVYIASQFIGNSSDFHMNNQRSVITFDKGGDWQLLTGPLFDSNGVATNCTKEKNCSLHLNQEFSHLYPGSRAVPIMSKASAPGLVMATGSLGMSIKHEADVFLSTNAGFTWHEVLKDDYYYRFGDHGGLIVAVRKFGITNKIFYSHDEGETWQAYTFISNNIRVYGLLTEPGEKSSVFSLFGSELSAHHWMIIQIDLKGIFKNVSCISDDYKDWSLPDDTPTNGCLLGRKTVYERKIAHASCYNGEDYEREITETNCTCTRDDFECDYGFELKNQFFGVSTCEHIPSIDVNKQPSNCPAGTYYLHTRGYRKIAGDSCSFGEEARYGPLFYSCSIEEKTDFLLYSTERQIHRVILGSDTSEVIVDTDEGGLNHVLAIDFDYADNCVYWADQGRRQIRRMCLDGEHKVGIVVEGGTYSIQSVAYDWTGGNIYWLDDVNKVIEVISKMGQFRRKLVNLTHICDGPQSLIVEPHQGLMFWLDNSPNRHRIMQSWMDGSNQSVVAVVTESSSVRSLYGLTLDHDTEKLYWIAKDLDRQTDGYITVIKLCDLNGMNIRTVTSWPHSVEVKDITVYKDKLYWFNTQTNTIRMTLKQGRSYIETFMNVQTVTDMKSLHQASQNGENSCSHGNAGCSQLCLPKPGSSQFRYNRTCRCGDGVDTSKLPSDDEQCICGSTMTNGTASQNCSILPNSTCNVGYFACHNGTTKCVLSTWKCDGDNDCSDGSDELDCPYHTCPVDSFSCKNGHCVPMLWRCDHDNDCLDDSDEVHCDYAACVGNQFECDNKRCVPSNWKCDFDDDCHDGSDERNCHYDQICGDEEFHCVGHHPPCIAHTLRCDGKSDCSDDSDEKNCTSVTCPPWKFTCDNGHCVFPTWRCDGDNDCVDNSDETGCFHNLTTTTTTVRPTGGTITCSSNEFRCNSGECINWSWKCDQVGDCSDQSDEDGCEKPTHTNCTSSEYQCTNRQCIARWNRCDGNRDCWDGSDEQFCATTTPSPACGYNEFMCSGHQCIFESWVCDGDMDCTNGEDERNCTGKILCHEGMLPCWFSEGCIHPSQRCDGRKDCMDGSDENGCSSTSPYPITTSAYEACDSHHLTCPKRCLPWLLVCDDSVDCYHTLDEDSRYCSETTYQVKQLYVESFTMDSATLSWKSPQADVVRIVGHFHLILSFLELGQDDSYYNKTITVGNSTTYTMKSLLPDTEYMVSILIDSSTLGKAFRPVKPVYFRTKKVLGCDSHHLTCPNRCLPWLLVCDESMDCHHTLDEDSRYCSETTYQVKQLYVESFTMDSATLSWKSPQADVVSVVGHFHLVLSFLVLGQDDSYYNNTITVGNSTTYTMKSLLPDTEYMASILVNSSTLGKAFRPVIPVYFRTKKALAPPQHVTAAMLSDGTRGINIAWYKPPVSENDVIGYRINFLNNTNHKIYKVDTLSAERTYHLMSELDLGINYTIWVTAIYAQGESKSSVNTTVFYKNNTFIDVVIGVSSVSINSSAVKISWTASKHTVKDYVVTYINAHSAEVQSSTSSVHITVDHLCPGTLYRFKIQARVGQALGPASSVITVLTDGSRVAAPNVSVVSVGPTDAKISWTKPDSAQDNKIYVIYYDYIEEDMKPQNIDTNAQNITLKRGKMSHVISSLQSCETYHFSVGMGGDMICPLSKVQEMNTVEDSKAPPKRIGFRSMNASATSGLLFWHAPCDHLSEPVMYQVTIQDLNNKTNEFSFAYPSKKTNAISLSRKVNSFIRGAHYEVKIRTDVLNSRMSEPFLLNVAPYSKPAYLKFILLEETETGNNGELLWGKTDIPAANFKAYEVFMSSGEEPLDSVTQEYKYPFVSYMNLTMHNLSLPNLVRGFTYAFKVRVLGKTGYPGDSSDIAGITVPYAGGSVAANTDFQLSQPNVIAIAVSVCVVVIALVIILVIMLVRHRRLQRSFLAYANSHYDIRSGTTTFTAADELGEDEDSPMIRGFSDDEPLVLA